MSYVARIGKDVYDVDLRVPQYVYLCVYVWESGVSLRI